VDAVLLVLDAATEPRIEDQGWMNKLARAGTPVLLALNKIDCGTPHEEALRKTWAAEAPGTEPAWLRVSALTGEGVPALTDALFGALPEGPALFPADVLTDYPRKLAVADVVREKLFLSLREELPHAVAVWVEDIVEDESGWKVACVIYVNKGSQKGIVIGEKGRLLRKVRRSSEAELANIYERPVKLDLWVKVAPNWGKNYWLLKKFGYVAS
jgi:GTP-binding protein Era